MQKMSLIFFERDNMNRLEEFKNYEKQIAYQKQIIEEKKKVLVASEEIGISEDTVNVLYQDVVSAEGKLQEIILDQMRERTFLESLLSEIENNEIRIILYGKYIQGKTLHQMAEELGYSYDHTKRLNTKGKTIISGKLL